MATLSSPLNYHFILLLSMACLFLLHVLSDE